MLARISGNEIAEDSKTTTTSARMMPPSIANLLELSTPSPRNSPVQAYAKLEFGAYSFYVQSLSVTLGRKAAENDHVDVHLGNTKAISRQHARVQYSFARNAFEIFVGGRNGLFVDDVFYEQGSVVPLDDRTQVQIGEIKFNFLLPHQGTLPQDTSLEEEKESSEELSTPSVTTPTPPPETDKILQKPDIPYQTLIAQSLLSHPRRRRTLPDIYKWIADHHPYFNQRGNKNWQSSIRQNLLNNQAFVLYDDGGQITSNKRSKRAKEEWGISPEYEGLIGDLTAKEGDTEKLSTKLNKKPSQPKAPKAPKQPKAAPKQKEKDKPKQSPTASPAPTQTQTEDASRVEEIARRMQGKGVDMSALLAEAFAKMKAVPLKPPQASPQSQHPPPAKRPKPNFPPKVASSPAITCPPSRAVTQPVPATKSNNNQPQLPITMPMPLPYTPKAAPIPTIGSTPTLVDVKKESTPVVAPVPVVSPTIPTSSPAPPAVTTATTESDLSSMSPQTVDLSDTSIRPATQSDVVRPNGVKPVVAAAPVPAKAVETAASRRQPRGKKRALES